MIIWIFGLASLCLFLELPFGIPFTFVRSEICLWPARVKHICQEGSDGIQRRTFTFIRSERSDDRYYLRYIQVELGEYANCDMCTADCQLTIRCNLLDVRSLSDLVYDEYRYQYWCVIIEM